jgi:hypothetical protein
VYLSQLSDQFNQERDIDDILVNSRKNNQSRQITGMLLLKGRYFLQLLEGEETDVKKTFGSICSDFRHHNINLLLRQYSDERLFNDWSMGFHSLGDIDISKIDQIINWKDLLTQSFEGKAVDNKQILEIFRSFKYRLSA